MEEDVKDPDVVEGEETTVAETTSDDPLDDIKDPKARADAKKARAIHNRHKDGETIEPPKAPTQDFVKKDDLAVLVTTQAKQLVTEEIRDNWDELSKIPLGGFNALDAHSIAKNMAERLVIFKSKKKEVVADPTRELSTISGTRGGQAPAPKDVVKDPPNFKTPVPPEQWVPESYRKTK